MPRDQPELPFGLPDSRRPPPPPLPVPKPPSWWMLLKCWAMRMLRRAWAGCRWILKHGSEIKTATWIIGIVGATLTAGVAVWQFELFGYRVRVEPVQAAPPSKGWDATVKKGK